jgi:hypothetical protein
MKRTILLILTMITLLWHTIIAETIQLNSIEIQINTEKGIIKANNVNLIINNVDSIQNVLGKPDRIEIHKFNSYIEEFPANEGGQPYTYQIVVTNYYYIYDQLGIMFYTQNSELENKEPVRCSIHFKNKRTFTNTDSLPFKPKNIFNGILKINGDVVNPGKKIISEDINYLTSDFSLFKTSFSTTSIATVIDGIYAFKSAPYLQFYLDNEKDQRISYLVIF